MNTTCDIYLNFTPCDLYRLGNSSSSRLDIARTSPPRQIGEKIDIETYMKPDGSQWVRSNSGGISVFNQRLPRMGRHWYIIPEKTSIPAGLAIRKDPGVRGPGDVIHYTIYPIRDMPLGQFISLLRMLSAFAQPAYLFTNLSTNVL